MKSLFVIGLIGSLAVGCATSVSIPADNSNCQEQVYRHNPNGLLLTNPEVHFVFWGNYWNQDGYNQGHIIMQDWDYLFSQRHIFQRLEEYGFQNALLDDVQYLNDPTATVPDPGTIYPDGGTNGITTEYPFAGVPDEINKEIAANLLPTPNPNSQTVYVVFVPPGDTTVLAVQDGYAAYHGQYSYGQTQYEYALINYYSNPDLMRRYISHELYEAFTDPDLHTGYYDDANDEVADLCENYASEYIDGSLVQMVWSQKLCQCQ